MKGAMIVCALLAVAFVPAAAEKTNPIQKVLEMLGDLEAKIIKEGKAANKLYYEFTEYCEETSAQLHFEIKTGKTNVAELTAAIDKASSNMDSLTAKKEELAGTIASAEADLKAATEIRNKEHADFEAANHELAETIDTITRAITIIEREMQGGASMLQIKNAGSVVEALNVMVQAQALNSADASKLTALIQSSEDDSGAPAAEVYKSHSAGIVETLEGLKDKATEQKEAGEHAETTAQNNFELLAQSLNDEIKFSNEALARTNAELEKNAQAKAQAEGDLAVTKKDLAEDIKALADLHHECMEKSNEFEAETKSRGEELKALAIARKVIVEATGGAEKVTYDLNQVSLLQLSTANSEAVRVVRRLAEKNNSPALAQLASRMASVIRYSNGNQDDIFAKVKGLIRDMIEKLEKEAQEDASHKAWCDKELAENHAKKDDKMAEIKKLSTAIDQMNARIAKLTEEVATLQKELAELAKRQAEMDALRAKENEAYKSNRADLEQGVEGVKAALKVLREYYAKEDKAHAAAEGAGSSIIGLLEVCESDFSTGLAETIATEEAAQKAYDDETKENQITKATKDQDVKYKTKETKGLEKAVAEATADMDGVQAELDAVNEYLTKLDEQCVEKAEPYAERKRRREAEIAGLKEALEILSGEAALIQSSKRVLRGARLHKA